MAAKGGCCCLRSLISFVVVIAIIVGGVFAVYNYTSLSTFGVTKIGDFELGELADVKFKDLVKAVQDIFNVNPDDILESGYTYDEEEEQQQFQQAYTGATVGGQPVTEENIAQVLTERIIYDEYKEITYTQAQLHYIFNLLLASGGNEVSESVEALGSLTIEQVILTRTDTARQVKVIAKIDISHIRDSLPAPINSMLGNHVYVTAVNEYDVTDGELTVNEAGIKLKLNNLDPMYADLLFSQLGGGEEEVNAENANTMIGQAFASLVNNLGFVGVLSTDEPAEPVSAETSFKTGEILMVTHISPADDGEGDGEGEGG